MSNTTSIRRAASIVGATGLIALSMAGPASARQDPSNGEVHRCTSGCYESGTSGDSPRTITISVDDNAFEVLQLGAGLLAGVALAGAGMAVASRRGHAHAAHPA
jgi:hypothetical protein